MRRITDTRRKEDGVIQIDLDDGKQVAVEEYDDIEGEYQVAVDPDLSTAELVNVEVQLQMEYDIVSLSP